MKPNYVYSSGPKYAIRTLIIFNHKVLRTKDIAPQNTEVFSKDFKICILLCIRFVYMTRHPTTKILQNIFVIYYRVKLYLTSNLKSRFDISNVLRAQLQ